MTVEDRVRKILGCGCTDTLRGLDVLSVRSFSQFVLMLDVAGAGLDRNAFFAFLTGARFYSGMFRAAVRGICRNDRAKKYLDQETVWFVLGLFGRGMTQSEENRLFRTFHEITGKAAETSWFAAARADPAMLLLGRDVGRYRECLLKAMDVADPELLPGYFLERHSALVLYDKEFVSFLTGLLAAKAEKSDRFRAVLGEVERLKNQDLKFNMFLN